MRRSEVWSGVRQRARRDVVLVVPEVVVMPAHATIVMLIVHMVLISAVNLALKSLTQARLLRLKRLVATIEQVLILPVIGMIIHAARVRIVRR